MSPEVMYNGDVTMEYDPIKHMYVVDGVIIPSVTKIIGVIDKPALIYWAVNETVGYLENVLRSDTPYTDAQLAAILQDAKSARFRKSKTALNIGSDAHDWIERHIKSQILLIPKPELPEYPPVLNAVKSYLDWEEGLPWLRYVASERRIYSKQHMYSGMVDITMDINGDTVVCDLKTSKDIYPEYLLQCAAYAKAIEEEDGSTVDRIMIIRIPKDGGYVEILNATNIDELFNIYLSCLNIWRWKNEWSTTSAQWTKG